MAAPRCLLLVSSWPTRPMPRRSTSSGTPGSPLATRPCETVQAGLSKGYRLELVVTAAADDS